MEEKYIIVKGEAKNHKNNTDVLDNTCNIMGTLDAAYEDARWFCCSGSRVAQVYKLVAEFKVDEVTVTTEDGMYVRPIDKSE